MYTKHEEASGTVRYVHEARSPLSGGPQSATLFLIHGVVVGDERRGMPMCQADREQQPLRRTTERLGVSRTFASTRFPLSSLTASGFDFRDLGARLQRNADHNQQKGGIPVCRLRSELPRAPAFVRSEDSRRARERSGQPCDVSSGRYVSSRRMFEWLRQIAQTHGSGTPFDSGPAPLQTHNADL